MELNRTGFRVCVCVCVCVCTRMCTWLKYNIPITSVQQCNSVTHIQTFFFHTLFHYGFLQEIGYRSLCHRVGPCCLSILSMYDRLHPLIPNSQSVPPKQHYSQQLKHENNLKVQWQMNDKQDVVHVYNGIILSHKKEWDDAICSNTDASRMDLLLMSQRPEKENIPYCVRNSIYIKLPCLCFKKKVSICDWSSCNIHISYTLIKILSPSANQFYHLSIPHLTSFVPTSVTTSHLPSRLWSTPSKISAILSPPGSTQKPL